MAHEWSDMTLCSWLSQTVSSGMLGPKPLVGKLPWSKGRHSRHTLASVLSPVLYGIDSMDRTNKYGVRLRGLIAVLLGAFLLAAVGACASRPSSQAEFDTKDLVGQAGADSDAALTPDGETRPAQDSPDTAMAPAPEQADVSCPSQNFDEFLKRYADQNDDHVRRTFTAMPLAYAVPAYTLRDDTDNLPFLTTTHLTSADRWRYFSYRYVERVGDYRYVGIDLSIVQEALNKPLGTYKFPQKVMVRRNGDREVTMGMEYEIDIFQFARRDGCWFLTSVTNPRD